MSHAYRKLLVSPWTTSAPGCAKLKPLPDPGTDVARESELFINFVPSILIGTDASGQNCAGIWRQRTLLDLRRRQ
jgi:hypothetical protein